jgi:putative ABC transport system ATP-binding protein
MKQSIIQAEKVVKCFGGDDACRVDVLREIDLDIGRGEFVAIMGPSGSGKTTLLDILGALLRPTSGRVTIDGERLSGLNDSELARIRGRKIGFIFQQYNLIPSLTAQENVELGLRINGRTREEAMERSLELLRMVGLGERIHHKPPKLSGGEQQRVAICRALANRPKIILGDEPTGNLDSKTGFMILNLLKRLNEEEGYTVLVVTHDHRIGRYTDRIVHMMDGRIQKR